jgi:hypothetical protein
MKPDPQNPISYNHPDRPTLHEADCGQLGAALIVLTKEVWVLRDRMMVTEAVLAERGIDLREAIEQHQPDAALRAKLDEQGAKLVASVLDALAGINKD